MRKRNCTTLLFGLLEKDNIHRIVKRAALRAELPRAEKVSPHRLRHAHATHALENHALIALRQATLGHVSLETTSKYLHIRPSQSSEDFLRTHAPPYKQGVKLSWIDDNLA